MPVAAIGGLAVGILGVMLWTTQKRVQPEEEETLPNTSVEPDAVSEEKLKEEA